jgi:anti-sigma regulatory factor (Ser/Thr protein kinase)
MDQGLGIKSREEEMEEGSSTDRGEIKTDGRGNRRVAEWLSEVERWKQKTGAS